MSEAARSAVDRLWRCVGVLGALLVAYVFAGRFLIADDLLALWLPAERINWDHASFDAGAVFYCAYGLAAAACIWFAASSLTTVIREGRLTGIYLWLSALTALAGVALSTHQQTGALGGQIMPFYWWALGLIWLFTNLVSVVAYRAGSTLVSRDWALYSVGLAFVPATALPQVPLWFMLDAMTLDQAMLTAVTSSFAAHYLIAHFVILEVLDD